MIRLERNPMPAGRQTAVTTEVRNVGPDRLTWLHDGCAITVGVSGQMADRPWRPGFRQEGQAHRFKVQALGIDPRLGRAPPPSIGFVPERLVNRGNFGCADIGISEAIAPGQMIRQRLVWPGSSSLRLGPPPSGPITLIGRFGSYSRGHAEPDGNSPSIEVTLDSWVAAGVEDGWLSPPEVVDAALRPQAFRRWLETQELGNGREAILWYRPELRLWEVGVLIWYDFPEPRMHLALVHPTTGDVVDVIDRPWSEAKDGFP
jgi:hypothetical protein